MAIFEAIAANDPAGLVIPEIIRVSGVPKSTVHRAVADFLGRGLIVTAGRRRKAPVFRLNPIDDEVVDVYRALRAYVEWRGAKELQLHRSHDLLEAKKLRIMARTSPPGSVPVTNPRSTR